MSHNPAEQEARFLRWCADNPEYAKELCKKFPRECLTPNGQEAITTALLQDVWPALDAAPFTEEEALHYVRAQLCSLLAREAGRAATTGDTTKVNAIYGQIEEFEKVTEHPPLDDYHATTVQIRDVVPTGVQVLDNQIRGLGKGELGITFAPPGRGKTHLLINFAVNAARHGQTVHYLTVADQSKEELVPRIDTCILGEAWNPNFDQAALEDRHTRASSALKGRIWIGDYTDRTCTIDDVGRAIREVESDLVIVDHADDVLSPYSGDPTVTRHSLRIVYMTLKQFSVKYQVPIWTASQSDDNSWHLNSTSIANMAEAKVGKATGAAIILGLSGGEPKKQQPGVLYVTIVKARRAYSERVFPVRYSHTRGQLW